ncbi:hypothetical protein KEM55_006644, partial [Ascosphaera atra]
MVSWSLFVGRRGHSHNSPPGVQAVLILKKVTDAFKQYDTDRDGYVTLSFEEFLTGKLEVPHPLFDAAVTFEEAD